MGFQEPKEPKELQVRKTLKGKKESNNSSRSLAGTVYEFSAVVYPVSLES